jgi:hypothetical protein
MHWCRSPSWVVVLIKEVDDLNRLGGFVAMHNPHRMPRQCRATEADLRSLDTGRRQPRFFAQLRHGPKPVHQWTDSAIFKDPHPLSYSFGADWRSNLLLPYQTRGCSFSLHSLPANHDVVSRFAPDVAFAINLWFAAWWEGCHRSQSAYPASRPTLGLGVEWTQLARSQTDEQLDALLSAAPDHRFVMELRRRISNVPKTKALRLHCHDCSEARSIEYQLDAVVASGSDAGGHRISSPRTRIIGGHFRHSQVTPPYRWSPLAGSRSTRHPCCRAGADGVQIGTALRPVGASDVRRS